MVKYIILFIVLFVTACTTSQPVPTHTSLPPTLSPQPIEVIFTGDDCTVTGPSELPAGKHTITFIDESDMDGELWLIRLKEGKTFQDVLNEQSEPGEWYAKRDWQVYDAIVSVESKELEGRRVDTYIWNLPQWGEHAISCYVDSPRLHYWVAPITIVEPPSE